MESEECVFLGVRTFRARTFCTGTFRTRTIRTRTFRTQTRTCRTQNLKIGQGLLLTGDPHVVVVILCFVIFGKNSKIQNGCHFWGGENF